MAIHDPRLLELLEQAKSEDSGERYEALEELGDRIFNQGTPGNFAVEVTGELCEIVRSNHPAWPDILEVLLGIAIDLTHGPARQGKENSDRSSLLKALANRRSVFAETLRRPCHVVASRCADHINAVELLNVTGPKDESFVDAAMALVRRDPDAHAPIKEVLDLTL